MLFFKQLDFIFGQRSEVVGETVGFPRFVAASEGKSTASLTTNGRDAALEASATKLLRMLGINRLAPLLRVEWNPRLRTAAGRADYRQNLISLNPLLRAHGGAEIDRTLRHELAHLLAHFRAGRRRINPHGAEWRQACADLGIAGESRCHTLPFPTQRRRRRFLYRCPKCAQDFPRLRRIRRAVACLACCRQHHRGAYHAHFQLRLVRSDGRD
ncbi:MAG: SprT-like domain-containing protein [Chthoniobacterales bacterium]